MLPFVLNWSWLICLICFFDMPISFCAGLVTARTTTAMNTPMILLGRENLCVLCHHGMRVLKVCIYLFLLVVFGWKTALGFFILKNLCYWGFISLLILILSWWVDGRVRMLLIAPILWAVLCVASLVLKFR